MKTTLSSKKRSLLRDVSRLLLILLLALPTLAGSCHGHASEEPSGEPEVFVPSAPDYRDEQMWVSYQNDVNDQGADIFYIPSTWEYDWYTPDGRISHHADPSLGAHRDDMKTEIDAIADYMAEGNNFYSPYYRHITLDSWATLNEDTINRRFREVSFVDIKEAFELFMASRNNSRPLILAGFSQGGKCVVELLKLLTPGQQKNLVAAYVMGYKVTPSDLRQAPWLKGAAGPYDTGVVVCYNSVSSPQYVKPIVSEPNTFCINPVNWHTDATPAVLDDTITVTLDERLNILVVEGYDGSALPNILDILNTGDYHGAEPWLYGECLRRNIRDRNLAFRRLEGRTL